MMATETKEAAHARRARRVSKAARINPQDDGTIVPTKNVPENFPVTEDERLSELSTHSTEKTNVAFTTVPLTVENVSRLNNSQPLPASSNPSPDSKGAHGTAKLSVLKDESTATVSVEEDDNLIRTSQKKQEAPKSIEKQWVIMDGLNGNKEERTASVDSYDSNKSQWVEFRNNRGVQVKVELTDDNSRVLSDGEADALSLVEEETVLEGANENGRETKRKLAHGTGSNKRKRGSERVKKALRKPPMDASLVGKCITVKWPRNGGKYKCLVMGCVVIKGIAKYKVFYFEDSKTGTVVLSKGTWKMDRAEQSPWNVKEHLGKRLYVYWEGEYGDEKVQQKAEDLFGEGNTKVPFEAFVVKFLGPNRYQLLYNSTGEFEDRTLTNSDNGWNVFVDGVMEVNGLPVIGWDGEEEEEEGAE